MSGGGAAGSAERGAAERAAGGAVSGGGAEGAAAERAALGRFVGAAPRPERVGLRALLALARRRRGARLLARLPAADQLARATLALVRYDEPAAARALGWDAGAVVARGREVRRAREPEERESHYGSGSEIHGPRGRGGGA